MVLSRKKCDAMKRVTILGSTGSIGVSCLDVVSRLPEHFAAGYLTTHQSLETLYEQARQFHPRAVAVVEASSLGDQREWAARFKNLGIEFLTGAEGVEELAGRDDADVVVNAIVGAAGLRPTLAALTAGKTVALANKETLVTAGELVASTARQHGGKIFPIDSEHSALWQCLEGESLASIETIILTASGGPFRTRTITEMEKVTVNEALQHPNWSMGRKITIDSATLMNKGFEVIEACWLFEAPLRKIRVLIHPQSIIHSMVEFVDGSIKAQMGTPDMRIPIQYALSYPQRLANKLPRLDFSRWSTLTFQEPDFDKFACLRLAYQAIENGGTAPTVLNAANEVAVHAFLDERLSFLDIPRMVDSALQQHNNHRAVDLESVISADRWARDFVRAELQR
jgi:1-deoxy-D-xylulose-5-phosphate reductoisomerase